MACEVALRCKLHQPGHFYSTYHIDVSAGGQKKKRTDKMPGLLIPLPD